MAIFGMFCTFCVQTRAREDGHIWHVLHFLRANKGKGKWQYLACFALFACKQGRGKMVIFGMFCTFCVQTRAREDGNIWHVLHFLRANKGEGRWSYLVCFALFACKQGRGEDCHIWHVLHFVLTEQFLAVKGRCHLFLHVCTLI